MKNLNNYIQEKLHINKDYIVQNVDKILKYILDYTESNNCDNDYKNTLKDWIEQYNVCKVELILRDEDKDWFLRKYMLDEDALDKFTIISKQDLIKKLKDYEFKPKYDKNGDYIGIHNDWVYTSHKGASIWLHKIK